MKNKIKKLVAIGAVSVLTITGFAASVTLAWDPSTATSFRVYYGTSVNALTSFVTTTTNTATINGIVTNVPYYFYATAFDSKGIESNPSNMVTNTVPALLPPPSNVRVTGQNPR